MSRNELKQLAVILALSILLGLARNFLFADGIELVADDIKFQTRSSAPLLSAGEAKELLEEGTAVFLDTREKPGYREAHVQGAANLRVDNFNRAYSRLRRFIDSSTPLVVYSTRDSPQKAGAVANKLLDAGQEKVFIVGVGIAGLSSEGLSLEKGPDPWMKR